MADKRDKQITDILRGVPHGFAKAAYEMPSGLELIEADADNCPPSETQALRQRVAELEAELRESRETNRRLNRHIGRLQHHIHSGTLGKAHRRMTMERNFYAEAYGRIVVEFRKELFARRHAEEKLKAEAGKEAGGG